MWLKKRKPRSRIRSRTEIKTGERMEDKELRREAVKGKRQEEKLTKRVYKERMGEWEG